MMRFLLIGYVALAVGCASTNDKPARAIATNTNDDNPLQFSPLAESALPKGKCGMILWTLESDRPMPILRFVAGEKGEIAVNGAPVSITLDDASGASSFGVFERQTFISDAGVSVLVTFHFGLGFDGGSYLERGLLALETPDGWRLVAPAAGVAGCRNK